MTRHNLIEEYKRMDLTANYDTTYNTKICNVNNIKYFSVKTNALCYP